MNQTHDQTRPSLLLRVRDSTDQEAWTEFYELYAPLLYRYARAQGLNHADAEEIRSQCCESLVKQIPTFEYDRQKGGFKGWLRTMVSRRVIDRLRRNREKQLESADLRRLPCEEAPIDEIWERQWREQHLRFCVQALRSEVSDDTWEAFRLLVDEGMSVPDVCEQLGASANQVYKARARMLALVRKKLQYLEPDNGSEQQATDGPGSNSSN